MTAILFTVMAMASEPTLVTSPAADTTLITRKVARQIFTGRKDKWANGAEVKVFVPPTDSTEMAWLSDRVIGLPPAVYQRFLSEQAYRSGKPLPEQTTRAATVAEVAKELESVGVLAVTSDAIEDPLVVLELE